MMLMIKLIMGKKGSGKTKMLVEQCNLAMKTESGDIVCIEKGQNLTYSVDHNVRLIDINSYPVVHSFDTLLAFLSGLVAENYDITSVFIDSVLKIGGDNLSELGIFLAKLKDLAETANTKFVISVSADPELAPDSVKLFYNACAQSA